MKTIRNLLFVLAVTLTFTTDAQELQTYDDGLDFKQENLDNFNKNTELKSSLSLSLSLSSTSYGNSGGNTSLGPYLIVGGLVFGTIGALGGTLGADYDGSTNNPKPFYRQGAHFLTALSGGVIFTTGIILTLNNR